MDLNSDALQLHYDCIAAAGMLCARATCKCLVGRGVAAAQLRRRQLVDDYFRGRLFNLTVLNANRVSFFHHTDTWNSSTTFGKGRKAERTKGRGKTVLKPCNETQETVEVTSTGLVPVAHVKNGFF
jgi:hypothetical protein